MHNDFDLRKFREVQARRETKPERLAREQKEASLTDNQRKEEDQQNLRKFR